METDNKKSGFSGFDEQMPQFLSELKQNNDKAWFEANKPRFEQLCRKPCLDLIDSLAPIVNGFDPPHKAEARLNGSFRRIHRDIRFSKDKTPYHTYLHLIFWTGDHPTRSPGLHLVFSPGGFGIGAGHWAFEGEELKNYRKAILDETLRAELQKAIEQTKKSKCHLDKPALKRLPKGFENTPAEAEEFLRQKGLVARNRNEDYASDFFGPKCIELIQARLEPLLPLQKWLVDHVYNYAP